MQNVELKLQFETIALLCIDLNFVVDRENKPNFLCGHSNRLRQSNSWSAEQTTEHTAHVPVFSHHQHKSQPLSSQKISTITLEHHSQHTKLKIHIPRSIKSQYNPDERRNPITFSSGTLHCEWVCY